MSNLILNKAKYSSDTDEWYTEYSTIEKEVIHYESQLIGKKILCNCDDPYGSEFAKFFLKNFNKFKLKKLICISYAKSAIHTNSDEKGLVLSVEKMIRGKKIILTDEDVSSFLSKNFSYDSYPLILNTVPFISSINFIFLKIVFFYMVQYLFKNPFCKICLMFIFFNI